MAGEEKKGKIMAIAKKEANNDGIGFN